MPALTIKTLKKIIRNPTPVFIEIGANVGRDSKRFLDTFKGVSLFCFEPDPRCIKKFKKRINDSRCRLLEMAVSNQDGKTMLHLSGGSKPGHHSIHINSSSIVKPTGHLKKFPWCRFEDQVTVNTTRLDTWFLQSEIKLVDFIWADTQGAEKQVIEGGIETLRKTKLFYTEYSDNELYQRQIGLNQIVQMLPDFEVYKLYPTNVLLRNRVWEVSVPPDH